jgi:Zn-dependent peptidase ImmA (M78 family)
MMNSSISNEIQIIERFKQQIPVDVIAIAKNLGVNVYSDNLPVGVSGKIVRRPEYGSTSGYSIIVNANEPIVRQRFTVAHEIAHFVLHRGYIGDGITENALHRSDGFSNWQEVEANQLAADILMPMEKINSAIIGGNTNLSSLASEFKVSEIAMAIRLGIKS